MPKPKIVMTVYKESLGYYATVVYENRYMTTQGDTFEELQDMIVDCVNLTLEDLNFSYTIDEIKLEPDLKSFFKF
jgi:predicted RNase H-like HicB family nuclease